MFTSKWIRFEASKVEEAVVLVSINSEQMRESFRKILHFDKSKPVERALSDCELERGKKVENAEGTKRMMRQGNKGTKEQGNKGVIKQRKN